MELFFDLVRLGRDVILVVIMTARTVKVTLTATAEVTATVATRHLGELDAVAVVDTMNPVLTIVTVRILEILVAAEVAVEAEVIHRDVGEGRHGIVEGVKAREGGMEGSRSKCEEGMRRGIGIER